MPVRTDRPTPRDHGSRVSGPDGAQGVCCPVGTPSCGCTPFGGWAPSIERCVCANDVLHWTSGVDEWGCPELVADPLTSCLDPPAAYESCNSIRGCSGGRYCADSELIGELGGPDDLIRDHPEGEPTVVTRALFPDGTCTPSVVGFSEVCDPTTEMTDCGEQGTCAILDIGPVCLQACAFDADCRDGYRCDPELGGCIGACLSDDECRISREETNGIEGLQPAFLCAADPGICTPTDCDDAEPADPEACADPALNFDRLVYDTVSTAECDPESYRCTG